MGSIPISTAIFLAVIAVLAVLLGTGRHHRGAIAMAVVCGVLLASVTGIGGALYSAVSTTAHTTSDATSGVRQ